MANVAASTLSPLALNIWRPSTWTQKTLMVGSGVAILALLAQVSVPLPFTPVPLTGQSFGVLLLAGAMGSRWGALTTAVYVLLGAVGLPIFADQSGGLHVVFGATGGYLLGFIAAAYAMGRLADRGWDRTLRQSLAMFTVGHVVIFAAGLAWLALAVPGLNVWQAGLLPFLPGAVVKTLLAAGLFPALGRFRR